jgi:putative ribosome biogenesis GTPase RsgA
LVIGVVGNVSNSLHMLRELSEEVNEVDCIYSTCHHYYNPTCKLSSLVPARFYTTCVKNVVN